LWHNSRHGIKSTAGAISEKIQLDFLEGDSKKE
jgi:hypothetical protein